MDWLDWEFAGLPLHPLFVHGAAVLIPIGALMLGITAAWPAAARKLTFLTPVVGAAAAAFAVLAHVSGEWLEMQVTATAAIEEHTSQAELMNPAALALAIMSIGLWLWQRYSRPPRDLLPRTRRVVDVFLGFASLVVAVTATVIVVFVGDSGARAVWLS